MRSVVLTGSTKAFAAGADIKEMKDKEFAEVYGGDFLGHWTRISAFRKPIVAAVSGYAVRRSLGGPRCLVLAEGRSLPELSVTAAWWWM